MKQKRQLNKKFAWVGLVAIMVAILFGSVPMAHAAQITSFSDTLTRLKAATSGDHEMFMVIPGGIAAAQVLTLTMTGFNSASVDAIVFQDVDFATGSTGVCTSAVYTEQPLLGTASGASWGIGSDASNHITITSGTGTLTAADCVRIRIGTNAVSETTGTNQILNGAAATVHSVTAAVNNGGSDSGVLSIDVITDDQVVISATVDPTMTFTIDVNSLSFGSLSSSTGRWATSGAGTNATAVTLPTAGNVLTIATNAAGGYIITYNGPTLTSSTATITATSISSDSDGTPGASQFALTASTTGSGTIASGYARSTNSSWNFIPSTATTFISKITPADTETVTVSYLANIPGSQAAGAYSTTLTYIATGTF